MRNGRVFTLRRVIESSEAGDDEGYGCGGPATKMEEQFVGSLEALSNVREY